MSPNGVARNSPALKTPETLPDDVMEALNAVNTNQRKIFCRVYAATLDPIRAWREAGYKPHTTLDYTRMAARQLLSNHYIRRAVDALLGACASDAAHKGRRLVEWLEAVVYTDRRELLQWSDDGVHLVPSHELSDEAASIIESVSQTVAKDGSVTVNVKTADRMRAANILRDAYGIDAPKQVNVDVQARWADVLAVVDGRNEAIQQGEVVDIDG